MSGTVKVDISGDKPAQFARQVLQQYDNDDSVQSITVHIRTSDVESSDSQEEIENSEKPKGDSGDYETDETLSAYETEASTGEEEEQEEDKKERERKEIRANTSHHRVLNEVFERSKKGEDSVSGKEIKQGVEGVKDSSIYPALTLLWERKLLDRERVEDVDNPYYRYYLTDYGKEMIETLGKPNQTGDE
ncbi:hypothetical protein [Salinigranum sp. GCM10025319]|uniref:hypothetical protein n=1 Tax=Salinigranum sp. GCM10025319 TaxID=3252687 RepID=UPI003605CDDC